MSAVEDPDHDPSAARPCVHKFGGSSLADAECFRRVAAILRAQREPTQVIVVSAMQGVTDALVALTASNDDPDATLTRLRERQRSLARQLGIEPVLATLEADIAGTATRIARARATGWTDAARAHVHGRGEWWSALCLTALLRQDGMPCALLDARRVLTVRWDEPGTVVDWSRSQADWDAWRRAETASRVVVTGFIARLADGTPTTLGRNGSDYSAAIFAALAGARELTLWGDTPGVLSADPRLVEEARPLRQLSYSEACELAYFGARVIHPQTMAPAMQRGLPIRVRSSFAAQDAGTRIDAKVDCTLPVKGLSLLAGITLLDVEGTGMLGVPGTAERVFGALHAAGISVSMISQGSSEHSICCAVRAVDAVRAQDALLGAFAGEIAAGNIQGIGLRARSAILSAVGEGMAGHPGVAARLLAGIARAHVNVRAIAQGASERSISLAVGADDATRALRAAHAAFLLSDQTLAIGVIGCGQVGRALLEQLRAAQPRLRERHGLDLRIRAIADSRRMWLDGGGALPADWRARLTQGAALDAAALVAHVQPGHLPHAVIIDCTASEATADAYADWLRAGLHVITPSKRALGGDLARWRTIREAAAQGAAQLRYEASVGAGLPVIQTLRELIDTGDDLVSIEGVLSGTLSWLFNHYDGSAPFSELLHHAHAQGYTEPDPRDDLGGLDVARKLVILAREAGLPLDLAQVQVESLVPAELAALPRAAFMARARELDAALAARLGQAREHAKVLRLMARLDARGAARVGLVEVEPTHAAAHLHGTDNLVQFRTRRYCDNPLVVQGPGAGPEVTAAGVFADILRLAGQLRSAP